MFPESSRSGGHGCGGVPLLRRESNSTGWSAASLCSFPGAARSLTSVQSLLAVSSYALDEGSQSYRPHRSKVSPRAGRVHDTMEISDLGRELQMKRMSLTAGAALLSLCLLSIHTTVASASVDASPATKSLKSFCVKAALRMPEMPGRDLYRARERNTGKQEWFIGARNFLVPAVCNKRYKRFMSMRRELQGPISRRWHNAEAPRARRVDTGSGTKWVYGAPIKWYPLMSGNLGMGDTNDPNYDDALEYGKTGWYSVAMNTSFDLSVPKRYVLYQCAPGPRRNLARIKIRNRVKDLKTGKYVGSRIKKFAVRVRPPC